MAVSLSLSLSPPFQVKPFPLLSLSLLSARTFFARECGAARAPVPNYSRHTGGNARTANGGSTRVGWGGDDAAAAAAVGGLHLHTRLPSLSLSLFRCTYSRKKGEKLRRIHPKTAFAATDPVCYSPSPPRAMLDASVRTCACGGAFFPLLALTSIEFECTGYLPPVLGVANRASGAEDGTERSRVLSYFLRRLFIV